MVKTESLIYLPVSESNVPAAWVQTLGGTAAPFVLVKNVLSPFFPLANQLIIPPFLTLTHIAIDIAVSGLCLKSSPLHDILPSFSSTAFPQVPTQRISVRSSYS